MGKIKDIDAELHELPDYEKGIRAERERIIKILQDEIGIDYPPIDDIIESIKNFGE
jgi:hypothetical protein